MHVVCELWIGSDGPRERRDDVSHLATSSAGAECLEVVWVDESQNRPVPVYDHDAFVPRDGLACTFWNSYVFSIDGRHREQPNASRTEPYALGSLRALAGAVRRSAEAHRNDGDRSVEGGRKQVARGNTAVRPPLLSNCQHLGLTGEVVQLVGTPDDLSQCKVTREDHVLSSQRKDERALSRPWANPWDLRERGDDLVVGQLAQGVGVQSTVGEALGEVAQGGDFSPRQASLAETVLRHLKELGRRG